MVDRSLVKTLIIASLLVTSTVLMPPLLAVSPPEPEPGSSAGPEPVSDTGPEPVYDPNLDLVAWRTATAPAIDGVVDPVWDDAIVLGTFATGNSGNFDLNLRAMFDDDYVYLLAEWKELPPPTPPQADVERDAWELTSNSTPGTWDHKDWGEDRLSFLFQDPDRPVANFSKQGCDSICHDLVTMHTLNPGETLDAWVWSSATTNPNEYADDGVLMNNNTVELDPKRHHVVDSDLDWDSGADGWWNNTDFDNATERPAWVWKDGITPTDARFLNISEAQQVDWDSFDVSTIAQNTIVPGHLLMAPDGDRADVKAKGVYSGQNWTVELRRLRDTGSSDDIAFDRTNVPYLFSPAIANNRTGEDHSKGITAYTLWLAEPETPDLVVSNVNPAGTSNTINSTVDVGVFVENVGWADAGASKVRVSWDEADAPDPVLADIPAIPWGQNKYVQVTVPTDNLTAGNNTLLVEADAEGAVSEINETNNGMAREVLLGREQLPNLVVDALVIDPPEVTSGAYADVTVTVSNDGDLPSPATTIVLYLDDVGSPLAEEALPAITAGNDHQWEHTWGPVDLAEGEYVLNVTVDPLDEVKELDETDNSMGTPFNMTAITLPDLTIGSVVPISTTVTQGDETRAQAVVANRGGTPVTQDFQVALFLNEAFTTGTVGLMATADVTEDLAAGDNTTVVLVWTVPGDVDVGSDNFLRAQVDWLGAVEELDEDNNNGTYDGLVIVRRTLPDLTVPMVSPQDPTVKMDSRVVFNITVSNVGEEPSSINTSLLVKDQTHNESIDSLSVPAMAADSTIYLEYEWFVDAPTTGTLTIQFLVDPLNHIEEENEFNNAFSNDVSIEPPDKADLTIPEDGISFFPEVPRVGEAVTISCTLDNTGTNNTGETTTVEVYLGNNRILTADLLPLGAGESRTLDMVWSANEIPSPMEYKLTFRVDPDDRIGELNETNNEREELITFVRSPEPVLENLRVNLSKDKVGEGAKVTLTVTITNSGDAADLVSIVVMDGVAEVASEQGVTVPAGGDATESFEIKLEGTGDHTLEVTIYRGDDVVQDPSGADLVKGATVQVTGEDDDGDGIGMMMVVAIIVVLVVMVAVAVYLLRIRK